jgi:hypothetical protein
MEGELAGLAEGMADLGDSLQLAAQALRRQGRDLGDMAESMEAAKPRIARWSNLLGWATGVLFTWTLISQYGLFALGGMLLASTEEPVDPENLQVSSEAG